SHILIQCGIKSNARADICSAATEKANRAGIRAGRGSVGTEPRNERIRRPTLIGALQRIVRRSRETGRGLRQPRQPSVTGRISNNGKSHILRTPSEITEIVERRAALGGPRCYGRTKLRHKCVHSAAVGGLKR